MSMPEHRAVRLLLCFMMGLAGSMAQAQPTITVGSKAFTESVILAEAAVHLARQAGYQAEHRDQLGGTQFLWNALLSGEIDVYPDYTGTLLQEVLANVEVGGEAGLPAVLATYGLRMTESLGFNNTYALGMREDRAEERGIVTISDLGAHPDLVLGFSNEFMNRGDGWPSLRERYGLSSENVTGIDHDLAYRGIEAGAIDVMDLYSTDAEIAYYNLRTLVDDLQHFPTYHALFLYRIDLEDRAPDFVALLREMAGRFPEAEMVRLNARAKLDRVPETQVAADFLNETFALAEQVAVETETRWDRLWRHTKDHLFLVAVSLLAAILLAVPLGVLAAKFPRAGQLILGGVGVIYTIPSLALLVFMIPLMGIGGPPAIVALFLYSLLPIVRNTHAGLNDIPPHMIESAEALGLPPGARLRLIELPLASRSILAGVKTSAVINVGTATLGALIGAGGYGQPILTGIRLDDVGLILEGAIPAAVLALVVQGGFEISERWLVPKGLRLASSA